MYKTPASSIEISNTETYKEGREMSRLLVIIVQQAIGNARSFQEE